MDRKIPADPANPASQEVVEPQAGQAGHMTAPAALAAGVVPG